MYKQQSVVDYKKHFKLPENYNVSGFLCHGTWKREEEIENLSRAISELGLNYKINILPEFLRRMVEIQIKERKFWFDIPYGGAMLSEYLQLACLFGSRKNILVGSCGGLSLKIKPCDIVIPTWSYGNESTTRMYSPENKDGRYFPDKTLVQSLKSKLPSNLNIFEKPTVTCQAMLAESWEDVQSWSKDEFFGVEMEASTVFSISSSYKVPSAALLVVADNLIKEETTLHENYQQLANKRVEIRQELMRSAILELLED